MNAARAAAWCVSQGFPVRPSTVRAARMAGHLRAAAVIVDEADKVTGHGYAAADLRAWLRVKGKPRKK